MILNALQVIALDRLRQRSHDHHPIASLAKMVANATHHDADYYDFNRSSKQLMGLEFKTILPVNAAILLDELYRSGELPPWVILELDLPAWKMVVPDG